MNEKLEFKKGIKEFFQEDLKNDNEFSILAKENKNYRFANVLRECVKKPENMSEEYKEGIRRLASGNLTKIKLKNDLG